MPLWNFVACVLGRDRVIEPLSQVNVNKHI
jgi:hypothetical protein